MVIEQEMSTSILTLRKAYQTPKRIKLGKFSKQLCYKIVYDVSNYIILFNLSNRHMFIISPSICRWLVMIQMSVFMLVLIYICGKLWVRCRERWEFRWPYQCCLCCCDRSNATGDNGDDDMEANAVLCYLCNKKVPNSEWNNSETGHRRYCAVRSKDNRGKTVLCK